jgi:hypothetical protein
VISSRLSILLIAAAAGGVLTAGPAYAQWWSVRGPVDFEECADLAERAATKEEKIAALSACNAKFAGRRKPGGGYTYFDFMQNRSFDIAGPNPTPEEQRRIDEQYTAFLDRERENRLAASRAAKQQSQQASFPSEKAVPAPEAPNKPQASGNDPRAHVRQTNCAKRSFSCDWPRLAEGIKDLKKLFGVRSAKPTVADRQSQTGARASANPE